MRAVAPFIALAAVSACAQVDSPNAEVVLPTDYRSTFVQVRDCRNSIEHAANVIVRVRADQAMLYEQGPYPFPPSSLVVKEQYGESDDQCQSLVSYNVMRKETAGYFAGLGDWQSFKLDRWGNVQEKGKLPG